MTIDLHAGTTFAGYRIDRLVGRGGMGTVYLAEDLELQRLVALKVLSADMAERSTHRKRFEREARLAASIDHPNVIPIYRFGEDKGLLYLAMRYVEGVDLQTLIRREGALDPLRAATILSQVARALDAAHAKGLIHRDVKPANVLLQNETSASDEVHCYLCDFGITRRTFTTAGLTGPGILMGTIEYVSPEQILGEPLDGRTDVYALGCVLFECLTGHVPFVRDDAVAVLHAHLYDPAPSVTRDQPGLPAAIDRVIQTAMAKSKEDRHPTCGALAMEVRSALALDEAAESETASRATTVPVERSRPTERLPPNGGGPHRRTRFGLVAASLIALFALAFGALLWAGLANPDASSSPTDPGAKATRDPSTPSASLSDSGGSTSPGLQIVPTTTQLLSIDGVTGDVHLFLAAPSAGDDVQPMWSRDGSKLVFVSDRDGDEEIYVMNADGTGLQQLTDVGSADTGPAWSPDGTRIVFVSDRARHQGDTGIWMMAVDGSAITKLTDPVGHDGGPAWSPDGTRIVFASDRSGNGDIYVMNVDGSDPVQLTDTPAADSVPAWSPDGTRIAFTRAEKGIQHVWLMNADGSDAHQLSPPATGGSNPAWSPRTGQIAYIGFRDGNREVFLIAPDGTGLVRLTTTDGNERDPAWAPDGAELLVAYDPPLVTPSTSP